MSIQISGDLASIPQIRNQRIDNDVDVHVTVMACFAEWYLHKLWGWFWKLSKWTVYETLMVIITSNARHHHRRPRPRSRHQSHMRYVIANLDVISHGRAWWTISRRIYAYSMRCNDNNNNNNNIRVVKVEDNQQKHCTHRPPTDAQLQAPFDAARIASPSHAHPHPRTLQLVQAGSGGPKLNPMRHF